MPLKEVFDETVCDFSKTDAYKERRLARFLISPELVACLGVGKYEVVENSLPADVVVVGSFIDEKYHAFSVTLCSKEFEEVLEGKLIPIVPCPMIRRIEDSNVST